MTVPGLRKGGWKEYKGTEKERNSFSSSSESRGHRDELVSEVDEGKSIRARVQRRERNDQVKRTVRASFLSQPLGKSPDIPFPGLYGSTGQDRDTTVVKLKPIRLYVRFDDTLRAVHFSAHKFSKYVSLFIKMMEDSYAI
jgi:hypothetical protein